MNRVNPSHMHPSWSDETAAAIKEGGGITGYVYDGVLLADDDPALDSTGINAFDADYSGNTLTVQGGEAFVHGTWLAIDETTDVGMTGSGTTVGVGWERTDVSDGRGTIAEDSAIVQRVGDFEDDDQYIPLWDVDHDDDGGQINSITDLRLLQRPIYNDFQGNVYMPYGDLDMNGNNVINTGNLLEGDEDLFVNRSGDDMYGPLEIVGDTTGGSTNPLTIRNDNTDSGTSTEIRLINSTNSTNTRGATLRSERTSDGGAELFFGIGDGSTVSDVASVNPDGIYADELQSGNISITDNDIIGYNGSDVFSFESDGIHLMDDMMANGVIYADRQLFVDSNMSGYYEFRHQGDQALEIGNNAVISYKRLESRGELLIMDTNFPSPTIRLHEDATDTSAYVHGIMNEDTAIGDEVIGFNDTSSVDPANQSHQFSTATGESLFTGTLTMEADIMMNSNDIRFSGLDGEGGIAIDNQSYYSSFDGWATIYSNQDRGGQGWRFRDASNQETYFSAAHDGVVRVHNELRVDDSIVLPRLSSRPSNPDPGTLIYRVDKDN